MTVGNLCAQDRQAALNVHFTPISLFMCTATGSQLPDGNHYVGRWHGYIFVHVSDSSVKNTDNYEECLLQPESLV